MKVSIIVAMDENRGIGYRNRLPWHLSADLRRFKRLTLGHTVIMGRKTYESIGKPLPGRVNIVITRNRSYQLNGCILIHSPIEALNMARKRNETEAFVIGGSDIFDDLISHTDRIYLTIVHTTSPADTFFTSYDPRDWVEISTEYFQADESNDYPTTFKILERI